MLILYNPPSSASRKPVLPMSLLALGAVLEGVQDYRIVDGNLENDPLAALDKAIRSTGASILGVTVMPGPQLNRAVPTCQELKRRFPDLVIVWGGYFPTQHYEVCLAADYVDYVVRGHGENTFRALVQALSAGKNPGPLPGLARRDAETEEILDFGSAPIPDPAALPSSSPTIAWMFAGISERLFLGERTLAHHSSYGCPFFCNFCAVVNMVNGRWKPQSASQTAAVVRHLAKTWGVDAVEFYDNNFFTQETRVAEFSQRDR